MLQSANKLESALRVTRVIAASFLVYIPFLAFAIERAQMAKLAHGTFDMAIYSAFWAISLADVALGVFLGKRFIDRNVEAIRLNSEDSVALAKWRKGHLIRFSLAAAIALYGAALRALGASLAQILPLYAVAFILVIFWWPQAP